MKLAAIAIILISLSGVAALSQSKDFREAGQIRIVVSETESDVPFLKGATNDLGGRFEAPDRSRLDYYFVREAKGSETWTEISDGAKWRSYADRAVSLTGHVRDGLLENTSVEPLSERLVPNPTVGTYKIVAAAMTIQAPGSAPLTVTPEQIRNTLFNAPNSVNNFYREASYGMFGFAGVLHPQVDVVPVTIPATISSDCQNQIITEFTPTVRQRLMQEGIDTTNGTVDLGLIIFNDTAGCPNYPFATRGALGARGVPLWVWVPESWFNTGPAIMAHEMGHALGCNHPVVARCTNFDDPQTCTYTDAADRNLMTSSGRYYMMPTSYERRRWGWHPPGAFEVPFSIPTTMFDLLPTSMPFGKESVKRGRYFFRSMGSPYAGWELYSEARRGWGLFENYQPADQAFRLGVTLRYAHSNYTDPDGLNIVIDPNSTPTLDDAPLRAGQQFTIGGVTTKCERESNPQSGARIQVQ